jgi:S1-C subfamily serine protease
MYRMAFLSSLAFFAVAVSAARAVDDSEPPGFKSALALQQVMQRVIARAEPSIACILVSRSDGYQRLGLGPSADNPGQLGGYDADAVERSAAIRSLTELERKDLARRLDLGDPDHQPEAFGSGVLIGENGLILTNYHVVRDATRVFVRLPGGKSSYADIYAADPRSDLAVLRLVNRNLILKAIRLGDAGTVVRGHFVISIANPFAAGFRDGRPSASWGIISNLRRRVPGNLQSEGELRTLHQYGTLLQTDARLNLGCSGGALLNLKGELIGLTTALAAIQGGETPGGFAIPIDESMTRIIATLQRGEEVEYGFLGIQPKNEPGKGAVLTYVYPGSPAERAGLHAKDIVLAVNNRPVRDADELLLALGVRLAGDRIRLDIKRDPGQGKQEHVDVALAKFYVAGRKIATELGARPFFRGIRVDYTSVLVQQTSPVLLAGIPSGVLISEVQPNSAAATALLKTGDIVTHVNGRVVNTPAAFYEAVESVTGPVQLTFAPSNPGQPAPKVTLH